MNYKETIQYMYNALPMFHRQGAVAYKKDLTNILALCQAMGNPHLKLKCFHIAGTNGKGSVTHLLAAVFQAHGYKTGVYVSPHYKDFRERVKINGEYISKAYVCRFIQTYQALFEQIKPSFFEMTVALAFCWFEFQKVDFAIIETGLGGRLDSTNIVTPLLSIITNISWDHSDILGDTLEKIAAEKAGIIKKNIPVLIGRKQEQTRDIFTNVSNKNQSEIFYAEDLVADFQYDNSNLGLNRLQFSVLHSKKNLIPSLKGLYQWENIRTVLAACEIIHHKLSIPLEVDRIAYALEKTKELTNIIGRWQIISSTPLIIGESAHNEDGIDYLNFQLNQMQYQNLHIVFGFVKEKPLDKIFTKLPKEALYYFVKAKIPRAMDATELQEKASSYGLRGQPYTSVLKALSAARKRSKENDLILITGSIFVVAEAL